MSNLITWDVYGNMNIRDIHPTWYNRVMQFMLVNIYRPNPLFKVLHIQDNEDNESMYLRYLRHVLENESCLIAVDDTKNEIHAVAILSWMTEKWKSWSALSAIYDDGSLSQLKQFLINFQRIYHREHPDHTIDCFHIFEYYIREDLIKNAEFTSKFFNAICEVGRHMKMPRITFVAMSTIEHSHALKSGFTELAQNIYSLYKEKKRRPFAKLRDIDEMYAAYYEKALAPLTPYPDLPGFEVQQAQIAHALLMAQQGPPKEN